MTDIVQGPNGFHLVSRAEVVDDTMETAASWAAGHIRPQPDLGWIVARYVEADRPNRNGHIFPLEQLKASYLNVVHKPLNMLHRRHQVIGAFTAAKLLDGALNKIGDPNPKPVAADEHAAAVLNPHVETLAAVWKYAFPDEYAATVKAFREGSAFVSMEAVPKSMTCAQCQGEFPYEGPASDTYCAHLLASPRAPRALNHAHFVGGGIIIPPTRPGWGQADIRDIAGLIENQPDEAELLYETFATAAAHLSPLVWEQLMAITLASIYGQDPGDVARSFVSLHPPAPDTELQAKLVALREASNVSREAILAGIRLPGFHLPTLHDVKAMDWQVRVDRLSAAAKRHDGWLQWPTKADGPMPGPADPDNDEVSAMVCLTPPADICAQLAAAIDKLESKEPAEPGEDDEQHETLPADQMHVTLGFFGTCDDDGNVGLDEDPDGDGCSQDQVLAAVAAFAATEPAMGQASISGAGIFDIGDGNSVIYASVDAPGLPGMRERLVAALAAAGVPISETHGLSPHISLEYSDSDEPSLPKIPSGLAWPVTSIDVWWGREKHTFELAGKPSE